MSKIPAAMLALCANFDENYCICIDEHNRAVFNRGACSLKGGRPCPYFKRTVMVQLSPDYKYSSYHKNPKQCDKVLRAYDAIDKKATVEQSLVRKCKCGTVLTPRRRFCDKCRDQNRRQTKRRYRSKPKQDN